MKIAPSVLPPLLKRTNRKVCPFFSLDRHEIRLIQKPTPDPLSQRLDKGPNQLKPKL